MGRNSIFSIGQFFGKLEILEILPTTSGRRVRLRCLCHYCSDEKIMHGSNIETRNSCGCQQHNSNEWKSIGPKNMSWQLEYGLAARNYLEFSYKRGAKKRSLNYNLTSEQFNELIIGSCHFCGESKTQIKKGQGKTSGDFMYTGIDRLDSSKGYSFDNCVSCCWMCNNMKHTTSEMNFINHIKKIYEHTKIRNL
jgi:hypothetical protein